MAGWAATSHRALPGHAWCWGYDTYGQVGDGPADQLFKHIPVAVASELSFTSLTAGSNHACGLDTAGQAWCWGWDMLGQVGDGPADQENKYAPIRVAGDLSFTSLAAGNLHTCGLDETGNAWCWGNDTYGQVGDGPADQAQKLSPVAVAGGVVFSSLTAGGAHTCGVDITEQAWCWGTDENGQIGDGPADQRNEHAPVAVAGGINFTIP